MSFKSCVYINCENYVMDGVACGDFTLFSFPKEPQRRKEWLSRSRAPDNLPQTGYYMCSNHFDKKYISCNNRRKVLIGPAIPFDYVEPTAETPDNNLQEIEITESEDNYVILNINKSEAHMCIDLSSDDAQQLQVGSTTMQDDEPFNADTKDASDAHNVKWLIASTQERNKITPQSFKRQLKQNVEVRTKRQHNLTEGSQNSTNNKNTDIREISPPSGFDYASMIDCSKVTTFIFKGEEYVQMPKEHYLQEKRALLDKCTQYEEILSEFKLKLNELNFN